MSEKESTAAHAVDVGESILGHLAAIVIGIILVVIGLALGVTMIMLPVGLVFGISGLLLIVWGAFERQKRS